MKNKEEIHLKKQYTRTVGAVESYTLENKVFLSEPKKIYEEEKESERNT